VPSAYDVNAPQPAPKSALKFFPNHLAYRPATLLPPPSRYQADNLDTLNALDGEAVSVVTIIRMPGEELAPPQVENDEDDQEGVMREWGGLELGIATFGVKR
jgi:hypothetical protein